MCEFVRREYAKRYVLWSGAGFSNFDLEYSKAQADYARQKNHRIKCVRMRVGHSRLNDFSPFQFARKKRTPLLSPAILFSWNSIPVFALRTKKTTQIQLISQQFTRSDFNFSVIVTLHH